jgi:hypothetical protein
MSTSRSSYSAASTVSGKDNAAAVFPTCLSTSNHQEDIGKERNLFERCDGLREHGKKKLSKEPVYEYDSSQQRQQEKENDSSANQFLTISDETPSPTDREMENPLFNNKTHLLNNPETLKTRV